MAKKVIMPKQGLQMTEGTIMQWLVAEGGTVEKGQPLFEMETDKLTITMDAEASGTLLKIVRPVGDTVPITELIAIIGEPGSYLDGVNCYDPEGEENYRGPHMINIQNCENIRLEGYTIRRSANWAHAIFCSQNITCRKVAVYGGHDGFDIRTCDHTIIEDCIFHTGDDCIAGFDNHDVVIRNCDLNCACNVFRFSGADVLIENCKAYSPARFGHRWTLSTEEKAARIETTSQSRHTTGPVVSHYCDFRAEIRRPQGNILVRNCEFSGMDLFYRMEFGDHKWCDNRPMVQIKFQDCKFSGVCDPAKIHGSAKEPITFEMENVEITVRPGFEHIAFMDLRDFKTISLENVTLHGYTNPRIITRTEGEIVGSSAAIFPVEPYQET